MKNSSNLPLHSEWVKFGNFARDMAEATNLQRDINNSWKEERDKNAITDKLLELERKNKQVSRISKVNGMIEELERKNKNK